MISLRTALWYVSEAEEAARFYVSLFPGSSVDLVTTVPPESPSGPPGSVTLVRFTLAGAAMEAISAGAFDPFTHAVSMVAACDDQGEIDRLWDAFLAHGAQAEQCGWLRDRYGLCWQIVPTALNAMIADPDRAAAARAATAMMGMIKFDIAALTRAHTGEAA